MDDETPSDAVRHPGGAAFPAFDRERDVGGDEDALAALRSGGDIPEVAYSGIRRTIDATFINSVANHPEIRPWLGGQGCLDLSQALGNPNNYCLVCEAGGFILLQHEPGVYEAHSQFLPELRRQSVRAMRDGFEYMFTRTDCTRIVTQVPDNNDAAVALARLAKFRPMFRREHTERGPTAYVGLGIEDWVQDTASLEKDGQAFHDTLEAAKAEAGSTLPTHPHDPAHDRAVGATFRMAKAGNASKGVALYNRWARFAGYAEIAIVTETPLVIDVGDAVVSLNAGEMEVLLCR